jgi:hypothetical protein
MSKDFNKKKIPGHKTFADELNDLAFTDSSTDEEEEEKSYHKSVSKSKEKRRRFMSVSITKGPTTTHRRLSYWEICEEQFIATFPVDYNVSTLELEEMVKQGVIMDENPEYVYHIHKKQKKLTKKKSF